MEPLVWLLCGQGAAIRSVTGDAASHERESNAPHTRLLDYNDQIQTKHPTEIKCHANHVVACEISSVRSQDN